MAAITYAKLTKENFNGQSLDTFKRYQEVGKSLRWIGSKFVYMDNPYVEDWDLEQCRRIAADTATAISNGAIAYGAFCEERIIGFITLGLNLFGKEQQYIELSMFHVTNALRGNGIGKALFLLACRRAKETGAKKVYISANSSKESQEAYRHLGCVMAVEPNQKIAEQEPWDIQMEYLL